MLASEYRDRLAREAGRDRGVKFEEFELRHAGGVFPFVRLSSALIAPTDRVILVRAGIHGDETAGPLTVLERHAGMFGLAHSRGLKMIVYPLGNPSGFQNGTRYNCDNDRGDAGNNDFLRYELADGSFVDDLVPGRPFRAWCWASDERAGVRLPAETRLQHELLRRDLPLRIVACLDLHQDRLSAGLPPAAYHYAFGDLSRYDGIVKDVADIAPVLRRTPVGAGFNVRIDAAGRVVGDDSGTPAAALTDDRGFIVRHDGSLTDLCFRLWAAHAVTVETSGATPLDRAVEVNLAWFRGLVGLAAGP